LVILAGFRRRTGGADCRAGQAGDGGGL